MNCGKQLKREMASGPSLRRAGEKHQVWAPSLFLDAWDIVKLSSIASSQQDYVSLRCVSIQVPMRTLAWIGPAHSTSSSLAILSLVVD